MAKKYGPTIKKLQNAINGTGKMYLTVNKTQFFVPDSKKTCEIIFVKEAIQGKDGKVKYIERFSSGSDIAISLYLRDVWYELNGWELPTDNEYWNKVKEAYASKQAKKGVRA